MRRLVRASLAPCLLLIVAAEGHAGVIDTFETGAFSLSRSTEGADVSVQNPDPAHCIATAREVTLWYINGTTTMSSQLAPLQNVDDAIETTFPIGSGQLTLIYAGGPWDLTEGGTQNQITVRVTGGGPTHLEIWMSDNGTTGSTQEAWLSATGTYNFLLSSFTEDATSIREIWFLFRGTLGETLGIQDISTTSGSGVTLIYDVHTPTTYTWACGPRGGAGVLSWDWAIGWPSAPVLSGPELTVAGVGGANCQGVRFDSYDSGGGGGQFGEVGLISVEWQAPTFDNAAFDMFFITDPNASYVAQMMGDPVVTVHESSFTIGHDVHVSDVFGIPDGTVHQDLIVSAAPGQVLYFDYVDVMPYSSGGGVGYSLNFGVTGAEVDPSDPLLEMYTAGSYVDDAGVTGVVVAGSERPVANALAAHPSVTRADTRFVISGATADRQIVEVFDVSGRRIHRLDARNGEVTWNATDARGARVPAGVYFGRVVGAAGTARVVLIR